MKKCLLVILYLIFINERMFMIITAFLVGYSFGYYLFEILRHKNSKDDIEDFFSSYNRKYGAMNRNFNKKTTRH